MNSTQWYSAGLRAVGVSFILFCVISSISSCLRIYVAYKFLKYVFYRQIPRFLRGPSSITWFEAALFLLYLAGNVLCILIGFKDASVIKRMGTMSAINLVPLALGGRMNFIASRCRIRPQSYERMHRWVGKVAIFEGLFHSIGAVLFKLPGRRGSPSIVAAIALVTLYISSNIPIRRYFYELFLWVHLILAGTLVIAVWLHTRSSNVGAVPSVYLLTAMCLWFSALLLRLVNLLYLNLRYDKSLHRSLLRRFQTTKATVMLLPGAFHICVKLAQPWEFRAGQWVYITLPDLGRGARFQSHPFVAAWSYNSGKGGPHAGRHDTVVLIGERRSGFTRDLQRFARSPDMELVKKKTDETEDVNGCVCTTLRDRLPVSAIIEGPYGEELDLGSYGTFLLFASGVGISHQVAYARRLLEKHREHDTKTQRVAIFWELEKEIDSLWVKHWMNDMLHKMDPKKILDIHLFVREQVRGQIIIHDRGSGRIKVKYQPMNVEDIIDSEIAGRKGRMLVSTCVYEAMADEFRRVVVSKLDKNIRLEELSFHPCPPAAIKEPADSRSLFRRIPYFLRQVL